MARFKARLLVKGERCANFTLISVVFVGNIKTFVSLKIDDELRKKLRSYDLWLILIENSCASLISGVLCTESFPHFFKCFMVVSNEFIEWRKFLYSFFVISKVLPFFFAKISLENTSL